jgi:hypothetical protein
MTMWRSVSALLVLSSTVACATATSSGLPTGTDDTGGAGTGGSLVDQGGGGSSESGSTNGGSVSSAGTPAGGSATGGSATGGSATGGGGSSAGSSGAAGHAGTATGGAAGTSSSGGAATAGTGGTVADGPCANPMDVTMGKSGNFGTTGAVCLRTKETFNSIGCSGFDGRTIKVNGEVAACTGMKATFAAMIDGYNYFDVSAGDLAFASFVWYTQ